MNDSNRREWCALEVRIELAGVPCAVRCRDPRNVSFFRDYLTDREPLFAVEPTDEDLAGIQADLDRMNGKAGIPKRRRTDAYLENNAIHALLAARLTEEGVLLMHGSALCMDGQGIIFTAPSGTGKSTHTRLWKEMFGDRVWIVNDDKPLISCRDGRILVWGTPWNGKHRLSRNASAPLRAIVSLKRSAENRIRPIGRAEAFPLLIRQCYVSKDPAVMTRIVDIESRLLDTVDFYELGCNMEPEAAAAAREGIK